MALPHPSSAATRRLIKLLRPEALAKYLHHVRSSNPLPSPQLPHAVTGSNSTVCLLGLDVGGRKIGVSIADWTLSIARPLTRIDRPPRRRQQQHAQQQREQESFPAFFGKELNKLIERHNAAGLVVGYPLTLWEGREGVRCQEVVNFMSCVYRESSQEVLVPFTVWDERMTTQVAREALRGEGEGLGEGAGDGVGKRRRKGEGRRQEVEDAVAATIMLQDYLERHVRPSIA